MPGKQADAHYSCMLYGSFISGEYKIPGKTLTTCNDIRLVCFLENVLKLPVLALGLGCSTGSLQFRENSGVKIQNSLTQTNTKREKRLS